MKTSTGTGETLRELLRDWYRLATNTSLQVKDARLLRTDSCVGFICNKQCPDDVTIGNIGRVFPLTVQRF